MIHKQGWKLTVARSKLAIGQIVLRISPYGELSLNPNQNNVVVSVAEIFMHFTAFIYVQVYNWI
jgi:hypothetical protein